MATSPLQTAPDRGPSGFLILLVLLAGLASAAALLWAVRDPIFVAAFLAGLLGFGAVLLLVSRVAARPAAAEAPLRTDVALLRAAVDSATAAVAITGPGG